jgi:hypothetical protein
MLKRIWMNFCQYIADGFFYEWLRTKDERKLDLYNKWIDRKFKFGGDSDG